jgi:hypothetical protein
MMLIYVAALLTLWSMLLYLRAAWPSLTGGCRAFGGQRQLRRRVVLNGTAA